MLSVSALQQQRDIGVISKKVAFVYKTRFLRDYRVTAFWMCIVNYDSDHESHTPGFGLLTKSILAEANVPATQDRTLFHIHQSLWYTKLQSLSSALEAKVSLYMRPCPCCLGYLENKPSTVHSCTPSLVYVEHRQVVLWPVAVYV